MPSPAPNTASPLPASPLPSPSASGRTGRETLSAGDRNACRCSWNPRQRKRDPSRASQLPVAPLTGALERRPRPEGNRFPRKDGVLGRPAPPRGRRRTGLCVSPRRRPRWGASLPCPSSLSPPAPRPCRTPTFLREGCVQASNWPTLEDAATPGCSSNPTRAPHPEASRTLAVTAPCPVSRPAGLAGSFLFLGASGPQARPPQSPGLPRAFGLGTRRQAVPSALPGPEPCRMF